ncbi:hypothetical protein [Streptomyces noursei]|uniref:hypothetical protein n=1 Tax=Streptomyces noursei TaxID=1971 RepID=UPI000AE8CD50
MDEGKAALYAAIIGFAAAIIGAAVGGLGTWLAGRRQASAAVTAALEQVNGQARNEEAQWIRQERRQIYSNVTRANAEFQAALANWKRADDPPNSNLSSDAAAAQQRLMDACLEVTGFGLDTVAEAAFAIGASSSELMTSTVARMAVLLGRDDPATLAIAAEVEEWEDALATALANFTRATRHTFTGHLPQIPNP